LAERRLVMNPPPATQESEDLVAYRIKVLEDNHAALAESLDGLNDGFREFRVKAETYAKAALIVFGVVHPALVGVVVYGLTR
jgi:hypothetical protein